MKLVHFLAVTICDVLDLTRVALALLKFKPQFIPGLVEIALNLARLLHLSLLASCLPQIGLVATAGLRMAVPALKELAKKVYDRMTLLGLNETELSERCSLAALHLFEDDNLPALTRDRISKILMNRQEVPAASAARIISQRELIVLANVLKVSIEWLVGQKENCDPVVWNVLAHPDRVHTFLHLIQAFEERAERTLIWSQYPLYPYLSEDFVRAFNRVHFGQKNVANSRALVEFYNAVARGRRKWLMRANRNFDYVSIMFQDDLERIVGGREAYSEISKSILTRNIQHMLDTLMNESLKLKLVIIQGKMADAKHLRNYEILGTVDNSFSVWTYHNGDIGWSEHAHYVQSNRKLLERLTSNADPNNTINLLEEIRRKIT